MDVNFHPQLFDGESEFAQKNQSVLEEAGEGFKSVQRCAWSAAVNDNIGSGVVNICTGQSVSLNELIRVFRKHFQNGPPKKYIAARRGDILHSLGDPRLAEAELVFPSKIPLEEGLAQLIKHETIRLRR